MKTKTILLTAFFAILTIAAQSQPENSKKYQKFRLSTNLGADFAFGNSNTRFFTPFFYDGFTLPQASKGFGLGFDGAYFFTKNYGVGIKYHFYTASEDGKAYTYDAIYEWTSQKFSFSEKTHFVGPAVYARWFLFNTKWEVSSNIGVVFLHNKLSNINSEGRRPYPEIEGWIITADDWWMYNENVKASGFRGSTIGFTVSAGISYRIIPVLGLGLRADGFFASVPLDVVHTYSSVVIPGNLPDEWIQAIETAAQKQMDNPVRRRINRIGISAEINFNF